MKGGEKQMYKKAVLGLIIFLFVILVGGCSGMINEIPQEENSENSGLEDSKQHKPPQKDVEDSEIEIDAIKEQIERMSLDEKIGQMLIIGLDGYILDDDIKRMIQEDYIGGLILFSRNVENSG